MCGEGAVIDAFGAVDDGDLLWKHLHAAVQKVQRGQERAMRWVLSPGGSGPEALESRWALGSEGSDLLLGHTLPVASAPAGRAAGTTMHGTTVGNRLAHSRVTIGD